MLPSRSVSRGLRLTCALSLLAAGCCCKLPGKGGSADAGAPSASVAPAPRAEPLASRGAPPWSSGVAQLLDAQGVYKKLAERTGVPSIDEQTLVCDVDVEGKWDAVPFFGAPDLRFDIAAGDHREVSLSGPEDTNQTYFSLARVKLERGEALSIHLHDRDATGQGKAIGDGQAIFDGTLPMRMSGPRFRVACQAISPEDQRRLLTQRLEAIDRGAPSVRAKMKIELADLDWGERRGPLPAAQAAVEDIAAIAGWEHPEVQKRAEAHTALREAWRGQVKAAIEGVLARLPAKQAPQTIKVSSHGQFKTQLLGARCAVDTCEGELEIEPLPGSSISRSLSRTDFSIDFVVQDGARNGFKLEAELTPDTDETLVAGKTYVLKLKETLLDTRGGANPARLLRITSAGSAHFFRLPDP